MLPKVGEWYLSVKCDRCNCIILIFHDLNHGESYINSDISMMCLRCKTMRTLPLEHYQHLEGNTADISIEILNVC